MGTRLAVLLAMAICCPVLGAPATSGCGEWPSKPAWEWSDEERVARRFDPSCLAARRERAGQAGRTDGSCHASGEVTDFVFGTDTPELFLPWQLFDSLLRHAFVSDASFASMQRERLGRRAQEAGQGIPPEFWSRIEAAAAGYLQLLRHQRALAQQLDTADPPRRRALESEILQSQEANCAARFSALSAVRGAVGEERFGRFLYEVVAGGVCSSGNGDPETLLWVGSGCPGK